MGDKMNDDAWVEVHERLGHKVSDCCYRCETCGQSYEQYMIMNKRERTIWLIRQMWKIGA